MTKLGVVLWVLSLSLNAPAATPRASVVGEDALAGCIPHAAVKDYLRRRAGEEQVASGSSIGGRMVYQIFTREDGQTWTLVVTLPDGRTCLLAVGRDWSTWRPAQWKSS